MVSKANNVGATVIACIALFVSLVGNAATLSFAQNADQALCRDSQENRDKIRQVISGSDPRLLKIGDPGYDYYASHPEERTQLIQRINQQLELFPAIDCS
jgi:hypothetical protein